MKKDKENKRKCEEKHPLLAGIFGSFDVIEFILEGLEIVIDFLSDLSD